MEANSRVDYIVLNEDLDGNISLEELISEIKKINKNTRIIFTSNKSYNEENIFNILKSSIEKTFSKISQGKNNYKQKNTLELNDLDNDLNDFRKDKKNKIIKPEIQEKISKKYNNKSIFNESNIRNNSTLKNNNYINKNIIDNLSNNDYNQVQDENMYENRYLNKENLTKEYNYKSKNKNKIFTKKTLPFNNLFNMNSVVEQNRKEVISILGPNGIGKSVFSILFAKTMESKKSIIMDFDILNKSLHTIMGVKNYEEKIKRKIRNNDLIQNKGILKKSIIHTNLKIDLLPALNIIFDSDYKLSYKKMKNVIEELKNDYDLIIIDTSSETFLDYTREIINLSNKSIFISGANLLEVRKSERLLEIYRKDWNIEKGKISIVFNKCTKKSLDDTLLKEIFNNYDILGKIQLSDYYDLVINKNMTEESKLKKEIEAIKKQIIKEKYYGVN